MTSADRKRAIEECSVSIGLIPDLTPRELDEMLQEIRDTVLRDRDDQVEGKC